MKKESIIVGVFGLSLGLLVAWGIWNFKSAAPQPKELAVSPSPVQGNVPTPTATPSPFLDLQSPVEGYVASESALLVSGIAKSGTTVVIATSSDDYVLTIGQNGSFSQKINLEEGENILTVTAYGEDKKEESIERTVVYSGDL